MSCMRRLKERQSGHRSHIRTLRDRRHKHRWDGMAHSIVRIPAEGSHPDTECGMMLDHKLSLHRTATLPVGETSLRNSKGNEKRRIFPAGNSSIYRMFQ